MKIPNILKRSGGVVTKLKADRHIKYFMGTVVAVLVGFSLCIIVYYWFDEVMNGYLVDWFDRNFMYDLWKPEPGGNMIHHRVIRWEELKWFTLLATLALVTVWIVSVRVISAVYASRREKETVRRLGQMVGNYMRHTMEAAEVFPKEYAEIFLQLAEVKSDMQIHEQLLKQEAGRKNDLITYLAHDLKTPLTSVVGYLSLLEEAPDMPDEQKARYVHIALDKAFRLEKLINEFFEITRYNLQQIVLEKETVDLEFMLVQMADEFYPVLQEHGNTVRLSFDGREWNNKEGGAQEDNAENPAPSGDRQTIQTYADPEKLARVFNNILKNAVAYSYPGTEISIELGVTQETEARAGVQGGPGRVTVAFSNHGRTIPRQRLDSVFEKFFRLDEARTTDNGGAGLGLAIAREIVTLHGGSITAQSENEVTVFTVELPAQA